MTDHTPTPWRAQERDKDGVAIIAERRDIPPGGTPTNGLVAYATRRFSEPKEIWEANAAFIVEACNSYDANRSRIAELEVENAGLRERATEGLAMLIKTIEKRDDLHLACTALQSRLAEAEKLMRFIAANPRADVTNSKALAAYFASGCIWDAKAILGIQLIEVAPIVKHLGLTL